MKSIVYGALALAGFALQLPAYAQGAGAAGTASTAEDEAPVVDSASDRARDARRGFALAVRGSTLGLGAEAIVSLNPYFNLRGQYNFLNYDREQEEDDITYDGKLDFKTAGLLIDWHPFAGSFRFSGGYYQNKNQILLHATCPGGCDVGDGANDLTITTNPGDTGQINGGVHFKKNSPYAGFGWGNAMKGVPLHFGFDIGVLFQGAPQLDLAATGTATVQDNNQPTGPGNPRQVDLGSDPQVQQAVAEQRDKTQKDVDNFKMWPVISLTLGYRFNF